jgi:anti-sigma-K factor RskA
MQHTDPELIDRLAGEYVLGTLRGAARARFARWIAADEAVARAVRRWEDRLAALAAAVPPVAPEARVWNGIAARTRPAAAPTALEPTRAPRRPRPRGRWLALAASVALIAVAGWFTLHPPGADGAWQTAAELRPEHAVDVAWRIEFDARTRELRTAAAEPLPPPPGGAHELWALRAGNAPPVSLGLLPPSGTRTRRLTGAELAALAAATHLAVSEEPLTGSPTGLPTGRVVLVAPRGPLRFSS